MTKTPAILVINAGSSSLKFALFRADANRERPPRIAAGNFERLAKHADALPRLREMLSQHPDVVVIALGHRIVHGGEKFSAPQILDDAVIDRLSALRALSPDHMPAALSLITALRAIHSDLPQVACFDTAFHHDLPLEAKMLPIPRRYFVEHGLQRYGFHGISYAYLLEELARVAGAQAAAGRVVLAHLGNGASMAAVRAGRSIDTTMALTPTAGLVMSSRSGDLDPGIAAYLARVENMSAERFSEMAHKESGLFGISEISGDVRDLLAKEESDPRAKEALAIFCYQARKWIGALAAALEGIDTLVFSGGIGEHAAPLRARICAGLGFLGVSIDESANAQSAAVISREASRVTVRVLHTDEEAQIARAVMQTLDIQAV